MTFLLILIFIFFVLPWIVQRISPWLISWLVRRQARRFMNGAFGGNSTDPGDTPHNNPRPARRKKKIDPTVGEYVEFTEIEDTVTTTTVRVDGPTESQVSDAEWEDLP